jgi:hypothetical protein
MKVNLLGGDNKTRSVIDSAQRCINLYQEHSSNHSNEPSSSVYLPTPGLDLLTFGNIVQVFPVLCSTCATTYYLNGNIIQLSSSNAATLSGPARCLYTASNGKLYGVFGNQVCYIDPNLNVYQFGTIVNLNTPVSIVDNGTSLLIADGTQYGWAYNMTTSIWSTLALAGTSLSPSVAPSGISGWPGANRLEFSDTFFIATQAGSGPFYVSGSESTYFDSLSYAVKSGKPDPIQVIIANNRLLWLIGTYTSELWSNVGGSSSTTATGVTTYNSFPYAIFPSILPEFGIIAIYSIAKIMNQIFWLAQTKEGKVFVVKAEGFKIEPISSNAMNYQFGSYAVVSDAIAFCYTQEGHDFYVISFPTQDITWAYDLTTGSWHQRAWLDQYGELHRHRGLFHAYAYGMNIVSDWQTPTLYSLNLNTYTDAGSPIKRKRVFPHMVDVARFDRIYYDSATIDMEVGNTTTEVNPKLSFSWSDDRGRTWSNPIPVSIGNTGQYLTTMTVWKLGYARDRIWQLEWSGNFKTSLIGLWVEANPESAKEDTNGKSG